MLISVFPSLASCHLGSLTIVSLQHILLQLALSVHSEKEDGWAEDREETQDTQDILKDRHARQAER